MFKKLFQALLVSAVATGTAILVLRRLDETPRAPGRTRALAEVDADSLSDEERDALLRELAAQL